MRQFHMVLIKSMNYSGGSGISSVRLKEKEYTQKIIHIPKPEIKRFEIKDYSALGLFSIGYW
ncbi:hypothetical protein AS224_15165 [Enterococcus faecium]|nr:hypothetical protein AWJ25_05995 [Enterococcus faecium]KWX96499.1 hypothetical protein AS224_15165 [Enterococcus faecium]KWY84034.1 hypothetical protein AS252_07475 [Enterococcus faecium]KWZ13403.1 hypothetical protein AS262_16035 [Enterococcus faecium]